MVLAHAPTTEPTRPHRVPATVPAVHPAPSSVLPYPVGSGPERTASERIGNDQLEPVPIEREQTHRRPGDHGRRAGHVAKQRDLPEVHALADLAHHLALSEHLRTTRPDRVEAIP